MNCWRRCSAAEGIAVHTSAKAVQVGRDGSRIRVTLEDGTELPAERLLVATGRRVDLGAVGLGAVGVDESARAAPTDGHLRVADGVWAVGDVTGHGAFTHVAMYQSRIAVADILGVDHAEAEYHAVPRVTFTDPEVGSVGLREADARAAGVRVARRPVPGAEHRPGLVARRGQRRADQAGRRRRPAASWSVPPRRARRAARSWASWPWPCTPECRSPTCAR